MKVNLELLDISDKTLKQILVFIVLTLSAMQVSAQAITDSIFQADFRTLDNVSSYEEYIKHVSKIDIKPLTKEDLKGVMDLDLCLTDLLLLSDSLHLTPAADLGTRLVIAARMRTELARLVNNKFVLTENYKMTADEVRIWSDLKIDSIFFEYDRLTRIRLGYVSKLGYTAGNIKFRNKHPFVIQAFIASAIKQLKKLFKGTDIVSIGLIPAISRMSFDMSEEVLGYDEIETRKWLKNRFKTALNKAIVNNLYSRQNRYRYYISTKVPSEVQRNFFCHRYARFKPVFTTKNGSLQKVDSLHAVLKGLDLFYYPDNLYVKKWDLVRKWTIKCKRCKPKDPKICARTWGKLIESWQRFNLGITNQFNELATINNIRIINHIALIRTLKRF